jgi:hypothetical protein
MALAEAVVRVSDLEIDQPIARSHKSAQSSVSIRRHRTLMQSHNRRIDHAIAQSTIGDRAIRRSRNRAIAL